jgi:hypothetical protein
MLLLRLLLRVLMCVVLLLLLLPLCWYLKKYTANYNEQCRNIHQITNHTWRQPTRSCKRSTALAKGRWCGDLVTRMVRLLNSCTKRRVVTAEGNPVRKSANVFVAADHLALNAPGRLRSAEARAKKRFHCAHWEYQVIVSRALVEPLRYDALNHVLPGLLNIWPEEQHVHGSKTKFGTRRIMGRRMIANKYPNNMMISPGMSIAESVVGSLLACSYWPVGRVRVQLKLPHRYVKVPTIGSTATGNTAQPYSAK